jgi:hypothetical protein
MSVDWGNGRSTFAAFDGTNGWGHDERHIIGDLVHDSLKGAITGAYLASFSHLVKDRMAGQASTVGIDPHDGAFALKLTPKGGISITVFLDATTFLPLRSVHEDKGAQHTEHWFDWRIVSGIKFPFQSRYTVDHPKLEGKTVVEEVHVNRGHPEGFFTKPVMGNPHRRVQMSVSSDPAPLEIFCNLVLIPVQVNGRGPFAMLLDTGTGQTILNRRVAKDLGLTLRESPMGGRPDGPTDVAVNETVHLTFPGLDFTDVPVIARSLDDLESQTGRAIAGLVGHDLFSRVVVEVDYAARTFRLHLAEPFQYTGSANAIPLVMRDHVPCVEATVGLRGGTSITALFALDTGSSAAVHFGLPAVQQHRLADLVSPSIRRACPSGRDDDTCVVGRIAMMQVGGYEIGNLVASLSLGEPDERSLRGRAGAIGNEVLRRFKVIFDYSRERVLLEKNAAFAEPFEADMSGLRLAAEHPDLNRVKIVQVYESSPAHEAGLREGDVLVRNDGRLTGGKVILVLRELFRRPGRTVRLYVQREGAIVAVELTPRPPI